MDSLTIFDMQIKPHCDNEQIAQGNSPRGGGIRGCAAGTLNTPSIHIISRLTKYTYSYNLHVK